MDKKNGDLKIEGCTVTEVHLDEVHSSSGPVAQLVEHLLCKQGVIGSNPFRSTK
jgi:hypothetical protein